MADEIDQGSQPIQPAPGAQPADQGSDVDKLAQDNKLAAENAKWRNKYRDSEDRIKALEQQLGELLPQAQKLKEIEEAQLSEAEKLQKKLSELEAAKTQAEQRARDTLIRSAVISEAARLNFNDPQDAYRLLDISTLTVADNGEVQGVADAVKALAESRKYLLKNSNPALSTFNPAGGPSQAVTETDAQKRARIYGSGGHIFDAGRAEQAGGGVVWPKGTPGE